MGMNWWNAFNILDEMHGILLMDKMRCNGICFGLVWFCSVLNWCAFFRFVSTFRIEQVFDILWSDPQHNEGCQPNGLRGAGTYFGPDVTHSFLQKNKLVFLVRSHECKHDGYEMVHGGKVISKVFLKKFIHAICVATFSLFSRRFIFSAVCRSNTFVNNVIYAMISHWKWPTHFEFRTILRCREK